MNNFKILMACTCLVLCSISNINAMIGDNGLSESNDVVSKQNNINVKQEIKELKSLCQELDTILSDIPLQYSEAVKNSIGRLQWEMLLFCNDYCDKHSYENIETLIDTFYRGSKELKEREPQNAVWEQLEGILEKMYDKFTRLTEFLYYHDYIPIDIDAVNNLYANLSKDAYKYNDLLPEADKLRTIAPKLTEPDPTDNDILDCYDALSNIMKDLADTQDQEIKTSLEELYPFYNYVNARRHIMHRS